MWIYTYTDKKDKLYYVGKTSNIRRRHRDHVKEIKFKDCTRIMYFKVPDNFTADVVESYLIHKYNPPANIRMERGVIDIDKTLIDIFDKYDSLFLKQFNAIYSSDRVGIKEKVLA